MTSEPKSRGSTDRSSVPGVIRLFYSYAPEDEALARELEKHLTLLRRQGIIEGWHHAKVIAGRPWEADVNQHLEEAEIILLLVSVDFLASDRQYGVEMTRALERHHAGQVHVIPIVISSCDWTAAPFATLQVLPRNHVPITEWSNTKSAWTNVALEIRKVVARLRPDLNGPPEKPHTPDSQRRWANLWRGSVAILAALVAMTGYAGWLKYGELRGGASVGDMQIPTEEMAGRPNNSGPQKAATADHRRDATPDREVVTEESMAKSKDAGGQNNRQGPSAENVEYANRISDSDTSCDPYSVDGPSIDANYEQNILARTYYRNRNMLPDPYDGAGAAVEIRHEDRARPSFHRIQITGDCASNHGDTYGGFLYKINTEKLHKGKLYELSFCAWSVNADEIGLRLHHTASSGSSGQVSNLTKIALLTKKPKLFTWQSRLDAELNLLLGYLTNPKTGKSCDEDYPDMFEKKAFVIGDLKLKQID